MDDSHRVRHSQRVRRFLHDTPDFLDGELSSAFEPGAKWLAIYEPHDEINEPIGFANRMDRNNVGMGEARRGLSFTGETGPDLRSVRQIGWQDFDGNPTLQLQISGQKDNPHAAASDFALDGVLVRQGIGQSCSKGWGVGFRHQTPDLNRSQCAGIFPRSSHARNRPLPTTRRRCSPGHRRCGIGSEVSVDYCGSNSLATVRLRNR